MLMDVSDYSAARRAAESRARAENWKGVRRVLRARVEDLGHRAVREAGESCRSGGGWACWVPGLRHVREEKRAGERTGQCSHARPARGEVEPWSRQFRAAAASLSRLAYRFAEMRLRFSRHYPGSPAPG